jgi:CheY-like chemotaxis protein
MSQTLVLSVGSDPMLLDTRNLLMQAAGYIVVSVNSLKEAFPLFQDGDFDLVILCHTLPQQDRERLTSLIRASGSRVPIHAVSVGASQCDVFAAATLEKTPVEFFEAVGGLLDKQRGASLVPVTISRQKQKKPAAVKPQRPGSRNERQNQESQDRNGKLGIPARARKRAGSY